MFANADGDTAKEGNPKHLPSSKVGEGSNDPGIKMITIFMVFSLKSLPRVDF